MMSRNAEYCLAETDFILSPTVNKFVQLRLPGSVVLITKQESPAIADKPARRESLPKIAPIRRAYNVVADNTGLSSFV